MEKILKGVNKCILYEPDGEEYSLNHDLLILHVPDKAELDSFLKGQNAEPPTVVFYRGKFCLIERASYTARYELGVIEVIIWITVDENGKGVLITSGGKVVWEEHRPA